MEYQVLKISGGLTDDVLQMNALAQTVKQLIAEGKMPVIVHGGGKQINALSAKLDVEVRQVEGRRITSQDDLEVLLYTVGGAVNRGLVSLLRGVGIRSVGLTGIDAHLTTAHRRAPLTIHGQEVDFGLVGEMDTVDPEIIHHLAQKGIVCVLGCLTWSANEGPLNINADTFAIGLAEALRAQTLVFFMEPEALWDANKQSLPSISEKGFQEGVSAGWIKDGMIPKLQTGFKALKKVPNMKVKMTNPVGLLQGKGTEFIL